MKHSKNNGEQEEIQNKTQNAKEKTEEKKLKRRSSVSKDQHKLTKFLKKHNLEAVQATLTEIGVDGFHDLQYVKEEDLGMQSDYGFR